MYHCLAKSLVRCAGIDQAFCFERSQLLRTRRGCHRSLSGWNKGIGRIETRGERPRWKLPIVKSLKRGLSLPSSERIDDFSGVTGMLSSSTLTTTFRSKPTMSDRRACLANFTRSHAHANAASVSMRVASRESRVTSHESCKNAPNPIRSRSNRCCAERGETCTNAITNENRPDES